MPRRNGVQVETGLDVSVSTGAIHEVVAAAESLDEAASQRQLTDEEKRTILRGGAQLGLNPPALIPHAGVAFAPFDRWEVGLRFAASGLRIGARRQLLVQEAGGFDLTIGAGLGRAMFTPPIHDVLDTVHVDEFDRWNFDLTMVMGRHADWYRWWVGPRFVYSTISETLTLTLPNDLTATGSISGHGLYFGGSAGAAFGYRSIFVGPELTLAVLSGNADVAALGEMTNVAVDNFVIYPSFALMGEF